MVSCMNALLSSAQGVVVVGLPVVKERDDVSKHVEREPTADRYSHRRENLGDGLHRCAVSEP